MNVNSPAPALKTIEVKDAIAARSNILAAAATIVSVYDSVTPKVISDSVDIAIDLYVEVSRRIRVKKEQPAAAAAGVAQ